MRTGYRNPLWRADASPRRTAAGGFTLLELLASSSLFAIIMVAIYMMYESNQRMFFVGDARATAQQNARIALDDIAAAIRMAGSFSCPPPPWLPWPLPPSSCPSSLGYLPPESSCLQPGSPEAIRIATADTVSLHGGYADPASGAPDCNRYVTYSLWFGGVRDTTLRKETRCDPWGEKTCEGRLGTQNQPLADNVTELAFSYFDANGLSIPLPPPAPVTPTCPSEFPWVRPRFNYALDREGPAASGTTPSAVGQGSQRDMVRTIRVEITVETNIAYDTASGCYRKDVGGPTQAFTLVSEVSVRGLIP